MSDTPRDENLDDVEARKRACDFINSGNPFMLLHSDTEEGKEDAHRLWSYIMSGVTITEIPVMYKLLGLYLSDALENVADFQTELLNEMRAVMEQKNDKESESTD